jgi:hypothetical protein
LAEKPDGTGTLEPLADFITNPAGAAIVNAAGPIRQIMQDDRENSRRYLVIARGNSIKPGSIIQIQQ